MAKKVMGTFKLQLKAGEATMAPPVGPAFGQRSLNGMEFVKQFNAKTAKQQGTILPAVVTFFSDKSFTFIIKSPPAPVLLIKEANVKKGSAEPDGQACLRPGGRSRLTFRSIWGRYLSAFA